MSHINIFLELTRLKKPIGYMLLFWPCAWGLTLAYDFKNSFENYLFLIFLFFSGSVLMRSAGCIINDIADMDFDKNVERTKSRPLASGKITIKLAVIYSVILCSLAFLVLINFNFITILLAIASMPLAFIYPLMKRFTYWPQLFLGITFNYGLILGWTAVKGQIDFIPILFYLGAIFWTLGYDTIYGYQDIKDDEIIGLKSTSIKFKNKPYHLLIICYSIFLILLFITGYLMNFNKFSLIIYIITLIQLYYFQLKKLNIEHSESCLKIFKSNNYLGFIVFVGLLIGKL